MKHILLLVKSLNLSWPMREGHGKVLANEKRCYIYSIFFYWPNPAQLKVWLQNLVKAWTYFLALAQLALSPPVKEDGTFEMLNMKHQGSFCVCGQPMRDSVTLYRLSLAGHIHRMIPEPLAEICNRHKVGAKILDYNFLHRHKRPM